VAYESFSVSELIPIDPERIYAAWLDSAHHTAITGDAAHIEPFVGGQHSSFDGYAVGSTVELLPGRRIVQTWRATDFPPGSPDSRVEVTLEATVGGTMVTIFHTEIPAGQSDHYRDGWLKYYLEPLKDYFKRPEARARNGVPASEPAAHIKAKTVTRTSTKKSRARSMSEEKKPRVKAKPAARRASPKKPRAKATAKRPAKAAPGASKKQKARTSKATQKQKKPARRR
jgi:uncharacterized protein YndB with AHSA1/START domain